MSGLEGAGIVASLAELIALGGPAAQAAGRATAAPGAHATPQRGRGMEFAETRRYQAGDDARTIDWRQTARRGRTYTKLFQEECEHVVRLLVDLGPSMRFGTRVAFKSVAAVRAAAWIAWRTVAAGDRVGLTLWNGGRQHAIPPLGRRAGILTLLRCLADASGDAPSVVAQGLTPPLRSLGHKPQPGSAIVIISDFAALDARTERHIAALARQSELMLIHVYDPFEAQPPPGRYRLNDGAGELTVDLHSTAARAAYGAALEARRATLLQLARRSGAALLPLATDADLARVLAAFMRQNRLRRAP
jgi:uncharacterized protein (DUF58 family)